MSCSNFLEDLQESLAYHGMSAQVDDRILIAQSDKCIVAVYLELGNRIRVMAFEHEGPVSERDIGSRVWSGDYVSYEALPGRRFQALYCEDRIDSVRKTREAIEELVAAIG